MGSTRVRPVPQQRRRLVGAPARDGGRAPGRGRPCRPTARWLQIHLARGTAAAAHEELISARLAGRTPGAGTRVADSVAASAPPSGTVPAPPCPRHNFLTGQANAGLFPLRRLDRRHRRALSTAPDSAFDPRHRTVAGSCEALAGYLARARGVRADPNQIVLTTGVMYSLRLLTPTVLGTTVAVESHGLPSIDSRSRRAAR